MPLTLHVAGGSFDLASDYAPDDVISEIESDRENRLTFRLADGGEVIMRASLGCEWALESSAD